MLTLDHTEICLCLVIYPWHYSLTGSAKYFKCIWTFIVIKANYLFYNTLLLSEAKHTERH